MSRYSLLSVGRAAGGSATGGCTLSTLGSAREGRGAVGAGGGWLLFSTTLLGTKPSDCLKTGNSGFLEAPSTWLRTGDGGSALLCEGSGILETGAEDNWASILLGGAGGSLGRVMLSSARLFVALELEEVSRGVLRLLRLTSGRLRPKRAMPALGELSICLEETSMLISVRREDAVSGFRPPDNSMRLMPVFGERGLEDSEGEDLEEE